MDHPFKTPRGLILAVGDAPIATPEITYDPDQPSHASSGELGQTGIDLVLEEGPVTYWRLRADTYPTPSKAIKAELERLCAKWREDEGVERIPSSMRKELRERARTVCRPVRPVPVFQELICIRRPEGDCLWAWTPVPALLAHAAVNARRARQRTTPVVDPPTLDPPMSDCPAAVLQLIDGVVLPTVPSDLGFMPVMAVLAQANIQHESKHGASKGKITAEGYLSPLLSAQGQRWVQAKGKVTLMDNGEVSHELCRFVYDFKTGIIGTVSWDKLVLDIETADALNADILEPYDISAVGERIERFHRDLRLFLAAMQACVAQHDHPED